ncbi:MAG: hypothetical protein II114_01415 [Treponema sp.]|nr:hypothetical protein [Treponema sp.]
MKGLFKRISAALILTLLSAGIFAAQYEQNPLQYFKDNRKPDYEFAMDKAKEIKETLEKQGYPYALEAAAIVFPEMIRYSAFQNEIESLINELLAFTSEESSGFSIGLMQMKPDFAVKIEKIIATYPDFEKKYASINFKGDSSSSKARHDRILRLRQLDYQIEYLKAFMDYEIMVLNLKDENQNTKIKYLSAAYNYGIQATRKPLEDIFGWKSYPSGKRNLYFNYQKLCLEAAEELKSK